MGKRSNAYRSRTTKKSTLDQLKPGDIISGDDLLGNKHDSMPDELRWLRGKESPFGVDVLDCRAFALNHVSTTANPDVAESFTRNQESDGRSFIGAIPENPLQIDYELTFPLGKIRLSEGPLFVARQMEEKWNVYYFDNILYFVRSWTGVLVHTAGCDIEQGTLRTTSITTNAAHVDERDTAFFIREIRFLIISHVLGMICPHPVPAFIEKDDETIAAYSFSEFGRMGLFASG